MAINFPTSLDTLTNPTVGSALNSPSHAGQHSDANDILEALEAKVGINSSAVNTTHDFKLSGVATADKAVSLTGSEVLTSKTLTSGILSGAGGTTAGQHGYDGTNKAVLVGDGTANQSIFTSAWKAFTPAITGAVSAIGNAVLACSYCQVGKLIAARISVVFGNTTSFAAGTMTIGLPVTGINVNQVPIGVAYIEDNGIAGYWGNFYSVGGGTTCVLTCVTTSSSYGGNTNCTNTIPFTFAATDFFKGTIVYEAA